MLAWVTTRSRPRNSGEYKFIADERSVQWCSWLSMVPRWRPKRTPACHYCGFCAIRAEHAARYCRRGDRVIGRFFCCTAVEVGSWPKAAVMGIRPGRQLSGDKRPTRPGLDNAIGVRRGTASKTPFRCRARAGRLKIAGENRWCRRGTNVTNEEEVGGAIAHGNPVGATSAVLRTQVGDSLA